MGSTPADIEIRVMVISVPLHLVQGKDVHRGKLLPDRRRQTKYNADMLVTSLPRMVRHITQVYINYANQKYYNCYRSDTVKLLNRLSLHSQKVAKLPRGCTHTKLPLQHLYTVIESCSVLIISHKVPFSRIFTFTKDVEGHFTNGYHYMPSSS